MGFLPVVFFLAGVAAHTGVSSLLPFPLKFLSPSIGWFFTSTILGQTSSFLYSLILGVQGIAAVLGYIKFGSQNFPLLRMVFCPFVSTILGGVASLFIWAPKSKLAIVFLIIIQLWSAMGGLIMLVSFPASTIQILVDQKDREVIYHNTFSHLVNELNKRVERFEILCENGVRLDTVIVKQSYRTPRWIVYFGGNAEFLETSLFENSVFADRLRANVIIYNSRGVGRSTGYVSKLSDLVEDAASVVQYVIQRENIKQRDILLLGHSIGGGVAAQIARWVLPESILLLDRTFSSLSDAAVPFSPFTPAVTKFLLPLCVGELDTIGGWDAIQHRRKLILYAQKDEIILYQTASIARFPQFEKGKPECQLAIELHGDKVISWHNTPLALFNEANNVFTYLDECFIGS